MPDTQWLSKPGRIETCTACGVSFDMRLSESTSSLVHRYTSWREAHATCTDAGDIDTKEIPDGNLETASDDAADERD